MSIAEVRVQEKREKGSVCAAAADAAPVRQAVLTPGEEATLSALLDALFPVADEGQKSATALGALSYILTALSGPYQAHQAAYRQLLAALNQGAGGAFAAAGHEIKASLLKAFEANSPELAGLPQLDGMTAFDLVWRHLREGLFCDPAHGGNRDFAGWELIGFPGAQFGYRAEEQVWGRKGARAPQSFQHLEADARVKPLPLPTHIDRQSAQEDDADVLIVGGGFMGIFMAHSLTAQGHRVVILEAGAPRTGREHVMDEVSATAIRNLGGADKFNQEVPSWRKSAQDQAERATMSQGLETALGGNSIAWGAVAMRFYEEDFQLRSSTIARYGSARIPAGTAMADWPMSYADLAPFYDRAEDLLGVSGNAGANPFEAPRKGPYAMKALRTSGLGARFAEAATSLGYHPFPLPAAILTEPYRGRHACTYCSYCSRFGCHVDAKASAQNTVLDAALATGLLRIKTGARVLQILTENGQAAGARYRQADGSLKTQLARKVIVATYAFENTRLLLLSKDEAHPQGLGNNQDQVGRYYMTRQQPSVFAAFEGEELNRFIGPTAQAQAIADLTGDHFDHQDLGFIRGGRIAAFNQYLPIEASGILPPDVPRYGAPWRSFFVNNYRATAMLFIDPEILPYHANRLDLDPDRRDSLGRPVTRITFNIGENERRLIPWLQEKAREIGQKMGATRLWQRPPLTGPISTHDVGGTRMGHDPASSVSDGFGRVHDTPGLYVIGGSSFVSLPAVNPALTILALSLRCAKAVSEDLG